MEVDPDPGGSSCGGTGTLKRSSSAPMINVLVANEPQAPISQPPQRFSENSRIRRLSSSSLNLNLQSHSLIHPTAAVAKGTDRIHQIKREESAIVDREAQHERNIQSAMQMSHSLDDFNLDEPMMAGYEPSRRPRSFSESLHIFTSPTMLCSSPSPTRVGKQCFSPSMQMPVRNNSFSPSPSPSPTRKSFHRSLSPIAVRPSVLGKRKLDESDVYTPLAKRFSFSGHTPDRLLTCMPHPLANSVSSGSQGDESSPEQHAHASSSIDHLEQPSKLVCFGFTPVQESAEMATDIESNITELGNVSGSGMCLGGLSVPARALNPRNTRFDHTKDQ